MRSVFLPIVILVSTVAAPAQARLYKWTDDSGQVHYGDSVPAQYLTHEHKELNEQGLSVKDFQAAETPEQRAERVRQELAKQRRERREAEQRQRDRVLLDTYTTERDLVAARDARLEAVDSQIQLSTSIIEDSKKKLENSQKQVDTLKAQSKTVPDTLYDKIDRERKQLETQTEVRRTHQEKREQISNQFNDYILRFRQLKAQQKQRREQIEAKQGVVPGMAPGGGQR